MPTNSFLEQFLAGWQMGQGRQESQRQDQELQMQQQRQAMMAQQQAEEFAIRQEEFAARKKALAAEEAAHKVEAAKQAYEMKSQAASLQGNLPTPTAQEVGIQQAVPDVGPPVEQINVPQPSMDIPSPMEGQPAISMPILTGMQQQRMAEEAQQRKMREALGMLQAQEGIKAQYREKPKTIEDIFAEAQARAAGQRAGAPPAAPSGASMTGEGGKPLLSSEINKVAEIDQGLRDADILKTQITGPGGTGAASALGAMLPNVVTEYTGIGAGAKERQAVIARVKQIIGKALEGGVLRKEDEAKYAKILPTISDPPGVAQTKIDGLVQTLTNNREILLENYANAGRDISKFGKPAGSAPAPTTGKTSKYKIIEVR